MSDKIFENVSDKMSKYILYRMSDIILSDRILDRYQKIYQIKYQKIYQIKYKKIDQMK